ncbi:glycosyltransferase [Arthrobacter sp. zg-Y40]|uniref:glycosyltransferase n=1 Tax=unclassified Arthrobacter TaxID=235627 RepID=UPI001D1424FE|nr:MULTISPECIES: glycosyltransferase [unclassified Arthrobacter]MCC3278610.1 glycosyltransferase [Arthrobacter sp. zg-Y40]MCC3275536.1 glycosyltransferase [Arthrobacter sp. zg-Y20]MDK1315693.1 glycosyltransferase [Arthrobacter sp. zg.Y20]MDK1326311.1 glycosyltransferase [Arthrobacter sp. zg-Y1143]WIB06103.1 glycosyltransferase [Arthrobacter sp. zg-Y20]
MRISMVSEHASPLAALGGVDAGGQNVHVAALSVALAARGHTVQVYTRRDDPGLPDRVQVQDGLEVVHVAAGPALPLPKDDLLPYMGQLAEGMVADWGNQPPDVVHSHFWMSGLAALEAVQSAADDGARVPVLHTFHALGTVKKRHQGAEDTSPPERTWLEPSVGRRADRVLATCSDEVFELKAMGVPGSRISIAPCGVDLSLFKSRGPAEPRGRRHRIAAVGRLVPRKGVDLAIQALGLLQEAGMADVELLIVGGSSDCAGLESDPEARRLMSLARSLGVADRVLLRGQVPREDMPAVLRSADAVVCAPWYEPFGIVPLEAMACAVPVVATAVGGLIDTVVHGKTGLLVPPRDPAALAAALGELLQNPGYARRLGTAGRQRASARYSWDRVAQETEKAYQLALRGVPRGQARPARLQPTGGQAL